MSKIFVGMSQQRLKTLEDQYRAGISPSSSEYFEMLYEIKGQRKRAEEWMEQSDIHWRARTKLQEGKDV